MFYPYTRRFLGSRQPLCGMPVISEIVNTLLDLINDFLIIKFGVRETKKIAYKSFQLLLKILTVRAYFRATCVNYLITHHQV